MLLYIYFSKRWRNYFRKVTVRFGLENFGVAPAGTQVMHTGHHHLIIDTDLPPLNLPIPADKNHVHFGKGKQK